MWNIIRGRTEYILTFTYAQKTTEFIDVKAVYNKWY
jgi:hypothetical protein